MSDGQGKPFNLSTKNERRGRDPQMKQTRKGKQRHVDMKLYVGSDAKTVPVRSATVTSANVHDKHALPQLLHGQERQVYGDRGYQRQREAIRAAPGQARDFTNRRARRQQASARPNVSATGPTAARVPESGMCSMWSGGYGALPRCAIAV